MLVKRTEFPEETELVLCTVTGIQRHAVFCRLDEFENRSGMIHISEIAAGRIRNIKEYVREGQKLVCKVLKVNKEKGYIDLSLRRVNEGQRRQKMNELKQEQLCEKIVEQAAGKEKVLPVWKKVQEKVLEKYPSVFAAFEAVSRQEESFEKLGLEKKLASSLKEIVEARIKPPELYLEGDFSVSTYDSEGVELVKKALKPAEDAEDVDVKYRGAGTYHVRLKTDDYKKGERALKSVVEEVLSFCKKKKMSCEWVRKEE